MQYEITFIVLDEAKQKLVKDVLDHAKAKVLLENLMGRKNMVYPIKKAHAGFYFNYYFEVDPANIAQINKNLQTEREILRFLIIKNDEDVKSIEERLERIKEKPKSFRREPFVKPEFELKKVEKPAIAEVTEKKQEGTEKSATAEVIEKKLEDTEKKTKSVKKEMVKTKKAAPKAKTVEKKPAITEDTEKKIEIVKPVKTEESIKSDDEKERIKKLEEKLDELLKD